MQGNSGVQNTIFPAFFNIQPKNNRETQKKRDGASRLVSSILNDLDYILTTFAACAPRSPSTISKSTF